jgi:IclR family transcriptional regulator, pca regulon regulatory protein
VKRDLETFVESFEKGLRVLTSFDRGSPRMTLSEVAERTSLTRAAARRFLLTLVTLGYASTDGKHFSLTPRVLRLGQPFLHASPLPQVATAVLQRVSDELQESSSLAVLDGDEIVYIARAAHRRIMAVNLGIGSRLPAFCTSMGRVLLAHASDVSAALGKAPLQAFTEKTVTNRKKLEALIDEVRASGHALVDQELEMGLRSIAVPVRGAGGEVVAAINVSGQAARVTLEDLRRTFLPVLQRAAESISVQLR